MALCPNPLRAEHGQALVDLTTLPDRILPDKESQFSIVGDTVGDPVAMKAVVHFGNRMSRLVLTDPSLLYLFSQEDGRGAFAETIKPKNRIKDKGGNGNRNAAAAVFADNWTCADSLDAMPQDCRAKCQRALFQTSRSCRQLTACFPALLGFHEKII